MQVARQLLLRRAHVVLLLFHNLFAAAREALAFEVVVHFELDVARDVQGGHADPLARHARQRDVDLQVDDGAVRRDSAWLPKDGSSLRNKMPEDERNAAVCMHKSELQSG